MTKNNSNRISLVIAVLAILLILGGVFLLNQSFNNSGNSSSSASETSSSLTSNYKVKKDTDDDEAVSNSTTDNDNAIVPTGTFQPNTDEDQAALDIEETDKTSDLEQAEIEEPAKVEPEPAKVEEPAPEPEPTIEEAEPPKEEVAQPVALNNNQFSGRITAINGLNYTVELSNCGREGLYCRAGTILNLFNLPNFTDDSLELNNEYIFTGVYSEDNSGIFVGSLSSIVKK